MLIQMTYLCRQRARDLASQSHPTNQDRTRELDGLPTSSDSPPRRARRLACFKLFYVPALALGSAHITHEAMLRLILLTRLTSSVERGGRNTQMRRSKLFESIEQEVSMYWPT